MYVDARGHLRRTVDLPEVRKALRAKKAQLEPPVMDDQLVYRSFSVE
jgi:hypothetical protein